MFGGARIFRAFSALIINLNLSHHSTMSEIGYDSKLTVVTSWLKTVFKDRAVPEFEINDQTVSALYELALKNKRRNHEQQIIINNNNRLAQEYQDEGELQRRSN